MTTAFDLYDLAGADCCIWLSECLSENQGGCCLPWIEGSQCVQQWSQREALADLGKSHCNTLFLLSVGAHTQTHQQTTSESVNHNNLWLYHVHYLSYLPALSVKPSKSGLLYCDTRYWILYKLG